MLEGTKAFGKAYDRVMIPSVIRPAFALAGAVLLTACGEVIRERASEVERTSKTIELDKSEMVKVRLKIGAGELKVRGGSKNLMDADFLYNVPRWKPEVHYDGGGLRGHLDIEQPSGNASGVSGYKYNWDLRFNDEKPIAMEVELGAGEGVLELGSLNLKNLDVQMGVGELKLDLRGKPRSEYQVRIRGGIGHVVVNLPQDIGIVAEAKGGIGAVTARGLKKRGNRYVNQAYEDGAKTSIRLDISGGIGQIELIAE